MNDLDNQTGSTMSKDTIKKKSKKGVISTVEGFPPDLVIDIMQSLVDTSLDTFSNDEVRYNYYNLLVRSYLRLLYI